MMHALSFFSDSAKELKKVTSLCACAMLTAIKVVVDQFTIVVSNILQIGFSTIVLGVNALYYGPWLAGLCGAISDLLAYILHPTGVFFLGFTLNEFLVGFIYGCFFYKQKITLPRIILAQLTMVLIVHMILTPLWLHIMYGTGFIALFTARIVTQIVKFPIDCLLLYTLLKTMEKVRKP